MNILKFGLLFALIATCYGYEAQGYFKDAAHPGKCVYANLILSPGEDGLPNGECIQFLCNDAEGLGTIQGCGTLGTDPPCRLGDFKNPNAPYPDCCDRHIICD